MIDENWRLYILPTEQDADEMISVAKSSPGQWPYLNNY